MRIIVSVYMCRAKGKQVWGYNIVVLNYIHKEEKMCKLYHYRVCTQRGR